MPKMIEVTKGAVAGLGVSVIGVSILSLVCAGPSVANTRPYDLGPEQKKVVSHLYPAWLEQNRLLSKSEKIYSDIVVESLCLTNENLAAEMGDMAPKSKNNYTKPVPRGALDYQFTCDI